MNPHPPPRAWRLTIRSERRQDVAILTLGGRISRRTSPILRQAIEAASSQAPIIVLDLGAVDYISSAGIAVLDRAAAGAARLVLCALPDPVSIPFDLAGLPSAIRVEPTLTRALAVIAADMPDPAGHIADHARSDR